MGKRKGLAVFSHFLYGLHRRKLAGIGILLACAAGCLVADRATAATNAMPPGSFLQNPAPDASVLRKAIHTDPLLVQRYMRTFHLSPRQLRAAFEELRLMRLPQDRILQVHYVHKGEVIGYCVRRVRRGTLVYTLQDGTPVLAQVCGNPLRTALTVPEMLLPPQRTASISAFSPQEPLPPLRTSGLTLSLQPMRSAMPPLILTASQETETPDDPAAGEGGNEDVSVPAGPTIANALLPIVPGFMPASLLSGIMSLLTHRGAAVHDDFIIAQDVVPADRVLPPTSRSPFALFLSEGREMQPLPSQPPSHRPLEDWALNLDLVSDLEDIEGKNTEDKQSSRPGFPASYPAVTSPGDYPEPETGGGSRGGHSTPPFSLPPSENPVPSRVENTVPEPSLPLFAVAVFAGGCVALQWKKVLRSRFLR